MIFWASNVLGLGLKMKNDLTYFKLPYPNLKNEGAFLENK